MTAAGDLTIYGASGYSRAIAMLFGSPGLGPRPCHVVAFIDDFRGGTGERIDDRPVVSWEEWQEGYAGLPCLVSIGNGGQRRRLVARVAEAGGWFPQMHEPGRMAAMGITAGTGTILLPPGYIGPNTSIGEHVHVMPMHSVGHDVRIGDFVTLAASVTVSGHVVIGEAAFIGAGATVVNGSLDRPLLIGAGAVVAAGAVVTKSVAPGTTVMGNPARPLRQLAADSRKGG